MEVRQCPPPSPYRAGVANHRPQAPRTQELWVRPSPVTWFPEFGFQAGTLKRLAFALFGDGWYGGAGRQCLEPYLLFQAQVRRALRVDRSTERDTEEALGLVRGRGRGPAADLGLGQTLS